MNTLNFHRGNCHSGFGQARVQYSLFEALDPLEQEAQLVQQRVALQPSICLKLYHVASVGGILKRQYTFDDKLKQKPMLLFASICLSLLNKICSAPAVESSLVEVI